MLDKKGLRIAGVVAFYFSVSITLVFLNKFIMNYSSFKFPYPLFITWYQMVIALICGVTLSILGQYVSILSFMPRLEFKMETVREIAGLSLIYVLMIACNNLTLKYVEVSFYQVARSLTICFNVLFTYTILRDYTSVKALMACGIVFIGYVVGSIGEMKFSWLGLFFGVLASMFVSLNSIFVKKKLPAVKNDHWLLQLYNTAIAIVLLAPLVVLSGEASGIVQEKSLGDLTFWGLMTITAVVGYLINIAIFMQIKFTSPLTNNISGTAKACVQTILSFLFFRNPVSNLNLFGIALCIGGSAFYSHVRYEEMQEKKRQQEDSVKV
eukprot:gb/GECH01012163.1/.p1 GENE.gb/GECH01012163.1/~~gb/GECH01012163.1/.p1  ORF type:complete len:324 (+),score=50.15 gb/GECH01012163.1/:1-972(+)